MTAAESVPVLAPLDGTVCSLEKVPDPVFAQGLVGPGIAIQPSGEGDVDVIAPISGKIAKIHPHAFVIMGKRVNVLVHLGLDTVKLEGEGFTVHADNRQKVEAGQKLITWNPRDIEARGLSPIVPVIFMETKAQIDYEAPLDQPIACGDDLAHAHD